MLQKNGSTDANSSNVVSSKEWMTIRTKRFHLQHNRLHQLGMLSLADRDYVVQFEEILDEKMLDIRVSPPEQYEMESIPTDKGEDGRKYRLASDVNQRVNTTLIGEKIMDTSIQLSIHEILAVSRYLHDQTRKRKISIDIRTSAPSDVTDPSDVMIHATTTISPTSFANINSMETKSYYALPSEHAKVILDDQFQMNTTLDNGSEMNVMPRRVFEQLDFLIDKEIN